MQYLTNAGGLTNRAEWEWWRPRITGIPDSDYECAEYKYFKRDALLPAIKEINKISDIEVTLHEHKTGRKITHIQFSSQRKTQTDDIWKDEPQLLVEKNQDEKISAIQKIVTIGVNESLATKLCEKYDMELIQATIAYVDERIKRGGVLSPGALFHDAIKKGYGKQQVRQVAKPVVAAETEKAERQQEIQRERK
jgi:plasmid replication initiation protein